MAGKNRSKVQIGKSLGWKSRAKARLYPNDSSVIGPLFGSFNFVTSSVYPKENVV